MGTSSSSTGPGKGVPMVPPWVPGIPELPEGEPTPPQVTPVPAVNPVEVPLAPKNRFGGARRNLSTFAKSNNSDSLRRGVGHYFKKGYGGTGSSTKRFGGTARTAGSLFGALSPPGAGARTPERDAFEQACRAGGTPEAIVTTLVEALRPVDGTQDAEAERKSLAEALADFLRQFPNVDMLNLTEPQRLSIVARYVALDVYRRFFLDVGKTIIDNAPTYATGVARVKEAKEYIRETVQAAFDRLKNAGSGLTSKRIVTLVARALKDAIEVFQSYTE